MANCYPLYRFWLAIWLVIGTGLLAQAQNTCPAPTSLTVSNITATRATVAFTGPASATAYQIMYAPLGVLPVVAPVVTSTTSPATLTGLMPSTTYWVCIQATCGTSGQSAQVCGFSFTTSCATNPSWPYTENFDAVVAPALPCGMTVLDANNDGKAWENFTSSNSPFAQSAPNAMRYSYHNSNKADDWLFTPPLTMQAGLTYQVQFKYRAYSSAGSMAEGLEVKVGSTATAAGQTKLLFSNTNITNMSYLTTTSGSSAGQVASFTPVANGQYYVGFHAISAANQWYLFVDDISVTASTITATKHNSAPGFWAEASPAPFSSHLNLSLNTLQAGPLQLTLHDAVGRVVRQHNATVPAGASLLAVPDVTALPAGVYLLTVRQGGAMQVIRVAHE